MIDITGETTINFTKVCQFRTEFGQIDKFQSGQKSAMMSLIYRLFCKLHCKVHKVHDTDKHFNFTCIHQKECTVCIFFDDLYHFHISWHYSLQSLQSVLNNKKEINSLIPIAHCCKSQDQLISSRLSELDWQWNNWSWLFPLPWHYWVKKLNRRLKPYQSCKDLRHAKPQVCLKHEM